MAGVATANAISNPTISASGTASWYRVFDSDDTAIFDGTVGTSNASMIVGTVTFVSGLELAVSSWTYTHPADSCDTYTTASNAARNAACDAVVDLVDAGAAAGYFIVYDGSQPAGPDTAVTTQNALVTGTFSDPAFGAAA